MLTRLQVEIEKTISTTFALTSTWIRAASLADSSESRDEIAPNRIVEKIRLNQAEHIQSRGSGHPVQPLGENAGLDIYHWVVYTTT